jgi:hypothetical protein
MKKVDDGQWTVVNGQCETVRGFFHPSSLIPPYLLSPIPYPLSPNPYPLSPIPSRRGVLLLLVLGLLALFGLVAVAFVIVTGHAQRSSKIMQRIDQTLEQPEKILNEAMMQVARGPSNPVSVLGPHSLLEDMYGNAWITGNMVAGDCLAVCQDTSGVYSGQLISFPAGTFMTVPEKIRRVGCVLTMRTGPAAGQSARIVNYNQNSDRFQIMAFEGYITVNQATTEVLLNNQSIWGEYYVNGKPFNGTGFGYDALNPNGLNATNGYGPIALQPNELANRNPPGGANEDYDAADYQNMALGAQIVDASGHVTGVIPSMHRPALANYWFNQLFNSSTLTTAIPDPVKRWNAIIQPYGPDYIQGNADDNCDAAASSYILNLKRRILLRPLPEDNPDFNGSNPTSRYFNYTNPTNPPYYWERDVNTITNPMNYRLDVDNDGDGVADSIWVDLGMPVRATKDGKLYKPLFAVLCVDMDGRLNLNAHGSREQANPPAIPPGTTFAGGAVPQARGEGYGPAEINLGLGLNLTAPAYSALLAGRYNQTGVPGIAGLDPLCVNKWFNYGNNYWNFPSSINDAGVYGSPPDPFGTGTIGLDPAGRPLFVNMGGSIADNPYELDLGPNANRGLTSVTTTNNPFSVNEFERLLRPFDRDAASQPGRLSGLVPSAIQNRHLVTTESWDVPCQSRPDVNHTSLADKLTAPPYNVPLARIPDLLPPEILAGLKLNLNRPFGNGRDDNNNGVVDESEPAEANELVGLYNTETATTNAPVSYDATGVLAGNALQARQLYARYLYVLAMLLCKESVHNQNEVGFLEGSNQDEKTARYLAQWAVNVVDFCDRDSIMTPFEYDPDPFTPAGWRVDGNISTTEVDAIGNQISQVAWGCERPELLITETLAVHDRRTEDTSEGGWINPPNPNDPKEDAPPGWDFDQRIKPQGSLFIELYNPWTDKQPLPAELSKKSITSNDWGVDLGKTTDPNNGNKYPVWRLAIVTGTEINNNPDASFGAAGIDRTVYFVSADDPTIHIPPDGSVHFAPGQTYAAEIAPILPGRYAVIGPGDDDSGGAATTYISYRTDDPTRQATNPTRRIVLTPNADPTISGQVRVFPNGTTDDQASKTIQPSAAIVISKRLLPGNPIPSLQRLSISEPKDGYPAYTDPVNNVYSPILDEPLDKTKQLTIWDNYLKFNGTNGNSTTSGQNAYPPFAIVHLQRLANPLMPYDRQTNPYRTIDSMPVDLTTFNGITNANTRGSEGLDANIKLNQGFFTRERGDNNEKYNPIHNPNLWTQEPDYDRAKGVLPPSSPTSPHYLNENLEQSLGYLNRCYGNPSNSAGYEGSPQHPFPWLTWNNRPFVSSLELMQVPTTSSYQLLGYSDPSNPTNLNNRRNLQNPMHYALPVGSPDQYADFIQPFPHLLNFFNSDTPGSNNNAELHRLLEYVDVPSRFVDTEIQVNPNTASGNPGGHNFHPPFNFIPTYREPGKINLNTLYNYEVFQGLMNNFPGMSAVKPTLSGLTFWDTFLRSRRNYGIATPIPTIGNPTQIYEQYQKDIQTNIIDQNVNFPAEFVHPFRSYGSASMVPPVANMNYDREINATLLRENPNNPGQQLLQHTSNQDVDNTDRNPFFRYQGLERLENLVTTRSNVYAVWITVGYFEVKPWPGGVDAAHLDGYQLGQELGMDTGEIQRHRAFYMFDRTIPVGFVRGQDLNVEKAIILKRFIE